MGPNLGLQYYAIYKYLASVLHEGLSPIIHGASNQQFMFVFEYSLYLGQGPVPCPMNLTKEYLNRR